MIKKNLLIGKRPHIYINEKKYFDRSHNCIFYGMIIFMNQKKLFPPIYIFLLLLSSSFISLPAISFIPDAAPLDPNNSALLLEAEDFSESNVLSNEEEPRYTISLSTMGRGDPLYVWFGHSAIVVDDAQTQRSVMYDYGIFSFDEGFYRTFALGRLWYESWATDTLMRFRLAKDENRDISLVHLNLSPSVALNVLNFVNKTVQPDYSTYLYHHYDENCSTKIRDIINEATDGEFKEWALSVPSPYTIRSLVSFHTASSPFVHFALNFLQSKSIDTPITLWQEMFLPEKLESAVMSFNRVQSDGTTIPLMKEREIIHAAPIGIRPTNDQSSFQANLIMTLFSILLALLIFISKRIMTNTRYTGMYRFFKFSYSILSLIWTLVAAIFSSVLIFMMVMSNHQVTYFNENILIISPLSILMLASIIHRSFKRESDSHFFESLNTISIALIGVLLIIKGVFNEYMYQANYEIMIIMLPLYVVNSTLFLNFFKKKRRVINNKTW